jgi:1-acyl-sn-glycerol-3-phosphate acyltransferase
MGILGRCWKVYINQIHLRDTSLFILVRFLLLVVVVKNIQKDVTRLGENIEKSKVGVVG